MTLDQYIDTINQRYKLGNATEHTFRGDLQTLIESIVPKIRATNEPKRQKCGAPDYILTKKDIPVGFIEAKDIGDRDLEGLKKTGNKEQFDRYKSSLDNLIFTDYLNFLLYREGQFVTKIAIAEITDKGIKPLTENFASFENLIKDFCSHTGQTIKSSKKLAEMMAGKARLLSEVIEKALNSDEENQEDSTLKDQMNAFKQILIHDITPKGFADVYAQTIAYGMFAARLHDPSLDSFSRQEAAELIPKSNPFLRKLFGYIAGIDVDDRIKWIVDDLVNIFLACNVEEILKNYNPHRTFPKGGGQEREDPIIHFYETFLSEYDPKLRKARGVWYTPAPVVNFIIRAVDDILKTEFDLPQGLADTSKTKIKVNVQGQNKQIEQEVHRVQILDPATGTATFLAEIIKQIYKKFEGQQGIWSNYVETHLLPRLNGFELLMASYAMAHLKLDLLLTETGFKPTKNQRFRVFLTNSLEEHHPDTGTLFANWLSSEANEANHIKRDTPVMCIVGNPPYSGESSNSGNWIDNLIEKYKKDNKGQKIPDTKWLNNDYVKFLSFGQHFIEKNGNGILAFITDNSFLDSISFRGMRWNLLNTYDKIYILNLHGNSLKKETTPDGSTDQNVFDIMQGVSISLFVKTGIKRKNDLAKVLYYDLYGKREVKYDFLFENNLKKIVFKELPNTEPNYFFVPKDFSSQKEYDSFIKINELLNLNGVGICSKRDDTAIKFTKSELVKVLSDFKSLSATDLKLKYKTETAESRDKKTVYAKENIIKYGVDDKFLKGINYRPFDIRQTYFTNQSRGFLAYPVYAIMKHFTKLNYGLIVSKKSRQLSLGYMFITDSITDLHILDSAADSTYVFPLYLYPEPNAQQSIDQTTERTPNLNAEIVKQIAEKLGLRFVPEKETSPNPSKGGEQESLEQEGSSENSAVEEQEKQRPGYITANLHNYPYIKEIREGLKENQTEAEKVIWEYLRNKKTGHKIRRQHVIDNFITDFVCLPKKVIIEIDGGIHLEQKEQDELRTITLNEKGYKVIRFTNEEVFANPILVCAKIKEVLDNRETLGIDDDSVGVTNQIPSFGGVGGGQTIEASTFAPIDILDYIYAVLHSPTYRDKYKEFLKIDFPRVPYPNIEVFWQLVKLGGELRQIHLLESPVVEKYITKYPIGGNNEVTKPKYEDGKVYINEAQYFDNVPEVAWKFYIGGYQPAQKWLKDRKDRKLEFDDILHYQKIIVALTETDRIMKEIDKIEIE